MPIIVRSNLPVDQVSEAWDENRTEVTSTRAPAGVRELAKSVCAFTGNPQCDFNLLTFEQLLWHKIEGLIKEKKAVLRDIAYAVVEKAKQDYNAALAAVPRDEAVLAARLAAVNAANSRSSQYERKIDSLPWPKKKTALGTGGTTLSVSFQTQPAPMVGSGFTFAPGFVMTAAHVLKSALDEKRTLHPVFFDYSYDERQRKTNENDKHMIKRIIFHNPEGCDRTPQDDLFQITGDDLAIFELHPRDKIVGPSTVLSLSQDVPLVTPRPDGLVTIGHPEGLPSKCSGWNALDPPSTRPSIRAAPELGDNRVEHPCIAVDVDVFHGNSGGPLIDMRTKEVLGVTRHIWHSNMPLPPRAATTSLHTEIQAWVTAMTAGATGIANTSPAALALLAGRFDQLEYYGEKLLAYRRTTPTNPSLTTTVVFNRVDHVAPFTRPLSAFIRPGSGNTRMFDFTLTLTISPCPVGLHLQPTIVVKSKPFPLGRVPTMYAEDLDLGDPARKFTWRRVCLHDADMTPPFLPTGGIKCRLMGFDMVYGDVPVEVFNHESGFCPWEGVSFPAETIHKSAKVTGTVEVVYGYGGVGSERNCAKFEHELAFGRHRGGEWDAYTASIGQTVFNGPFVQKSGSHWKGPTGVIMKANRLYGRSNPKAME